LRRFLLGLVHLFPEGFRREFGEDMREQIGQDHDRAASRGRVAALWFSVTTGADVLASALWEHLSPTWLGEPRSQHTHTLGRGRMTMGDWLMDLRRAGRSLRRAPAFAAVTVGTLALAIGVNTGIFSVVRAVLLEPLPFERTDELVVIRGTAGPDLSYGLAEEFYLQFRDSEVLESVAWFVDFTSSLRVGDEMERAWMGGGSSNFLETLGVAPVVGRLPTPEEEGRVAVLSHAFWTDRYGADPDVLGRTIFASGADLTIIGVMPPDFFFPPAEGVTLLIPQEIEAADVTPDIVTGFLSILARVRPGVGAQELEAELTTLARRIPERFGGSAAYAQQVNDFRPLVVPLQEEILGNARGPLWILFAAVGVVLFIGCANVANLFMVRAEDRLRETAVRRALGAGRARLIGSLFSEAVLVAALAGGFAMALAWVCLPLILTAAPDVPRLGNVGLGAAALAFAAGVSALCALACGLVPALRSSAPDLGRLRDGSRGSTRRRSLGRDTLVAAQTALALVLLIGSGLLVQSFWRLSNVDPGYDTEDIFTFQIAPVSEELFDGPSYARFHMSFVERLRALPGVESVGIIENVPLNEGLSQGRFLREEETGDPDAGEALSYTFASGEAFETMGIDILEGAAFTADDLELGLTNVVLSRSTADLLWPGESAIGRSLVSGATGTAYTVIGVAEDILQDDFRDAPRPMFWFPLVGATATSWALASPGYVVRTSRAETIAPEVRELVREVAPGAPMYRVFTMADLAADTMVELSFTTLMLGIVSALALILGAVGLYGILSYVVAQRRREIGVRMALGAQAGRVQRMVVVQGARVVVVGVVTGSIVAVASTRVLERLLFDVEPADASTFLAMSAALVAIGLLASWLPARRASRVDPVESLRGE
jgi:predicted permease